MSHFFILKNTLLRQSLSLKIVFDRINIIDITGTIYSNNLNFKNYVNYIDIEAVLSTIISILIITRIFRIFCYLPLPGRHEHSTFIINTDFYQSAENSLYQKFE